jgi:hypothetical protein
MTEKNQMYSGTVVGKLEGEREITLGFVDLIRDEYIEKDKPCELPISGCCHTVKIAYDINHNQLGT